MEPWILASAVAQRQFPAGISMHIKVYLLFELLQHAVVKFLESIWTAVVPKLHK